MESSSTEITYIHRSPAPLGRVAVLIPVYKDRGTLGQTLASLADQGVSATAVVVDDGSPDPITLDPAGLPVPTVLVRLPRNEGIEGALNAGLSWIHAAGFTYVARLDNGDRCFPGRLAAQVGFLDANPDVGMIGTGVQWETANETTVFTRIPSTSSQQLKAAFAFNCPLIHPTVCIRASVLRELGGYATWAPAAEDYELFWRIAQHHRIAALADVLVGTRFDPEGISQRRRATQLRSRAAVQLRYAQWSRPATYLGLAQTFVLRCVPYRAVVWIKRRRTSRPTAPHTLPLSPS